MLTLFIFKSDSRATQFGIGTYIRELTNALIAFSNISIVIVSYKCKGYSEVTIKDESSRLSYIYIPGSYSAEKNGEKRYASAVVRALSGLIISAGKVVFQMNQLDDLPIALCLREKYQYPIISIVHGTQYQQFFNGNKKKLEGLNIENPINIQEEKISQEKKLYSISDQIISVTAYMKRFLSDFYKVDPLKITIVPNGINHEHYPVLSNKEKSIIRNEFGFSINDIIILFSGRIDPCKGAGELLEAFQSACRKMDNLRLVLLGNGNIQEYLQLIKSDFGKVTFAGFRERENVDSFYAIADIGIVPSIYDHCPYTVLELISNNVPLIMSFIEGLNEILDDSECLFVNTSVDAKGEIKIDIEELSESILRLARDTELRKKISEKSHLKLNQKHTARIMAESMNNMLMAL